MRLDVQVRALRWQEPSFSSAVDWLRERLGDSKWWKNERRVALRIDKKKLPREPAAKDWVVFSRNVRDLVRDLLRQPYPVQAKLGEKAEWARRVVLTLRLLVDEQFARDASGNEAIPGTAWHAGGLQWLAEASTRHRECTGPQVEAPRDRTPDRTIVEELYDRVEMALAILAEQEVREAPDEATLAQLRALSNRGRKVLFALLDLPAYAGISANALSMSGSELGGHSKIRQVLNEELGELVEYSGRGTGWRVRADARPALVQARANLAAQEAGN